MTFEIRLYCLEYLLNQCLFTAEYAYFCIRIKVEQSSGEFVLSFIFTINKIHIAMTKPIKRILYFGLLLAIVGLMIASCSKYPTYTVNTSDLDMVWTNYNESTDFSLYKTYYVPDSILVDSTLSSEDKAYMQEYYESILVAIHSNMEALNYVYVDSSMSPDIGMGVSIITRTTHVVSYNYWYYYPPYWGYPGYGYYYPWGTYLGSYDEGAVIIDMADLKNIDHTSRTISAVWASLVGGVLTGNSSSVISQRLIGGIDQAFKQSPYLGTDQ
jgi:hypothetical protein